jgi:hypothetical protein
LTCNEIQHLFAALGAAPVADTGVGLLGAEQPGLEVLGDSADGGGATRAALRAAGHLQTIKPIPLQSAVPGGFTIHDVRIDRSAGMLRCPAGTTAPITSSGRVSFARACPSCPLRRRCTTAKGGRILHLHPHEDELRAARRRATTRSFQHSYRRWRPMGERSIAWLVADGCRRVPYRGIEPNELWWSVRVAAVNLRRLLALGLARQDAAWVLACARPPAYSRCPGAAHRPPSILPIGRMQSHHRNHRPDTTGRLQQAPRAAGGTTGRVLPRRHGAPGLAQGRYVPRLDVVQNGHDAGHHRRYRMTAP